MRAAGLEGIPRPDLVSYIVACRPGSWYPESAVSRAVPGHPDLVALASASAVKDRRWCGGDGGGEDPAEGHFNPGAYSVGRLGELEHRIGPRGQALVEGGADPGVVVLSMDYRTAGSVLPICSTSPRRPTTHGGAREPQRGANPANSP